ncbi:methyl-accepting chemotaxis protein [Ramlibacter sp. MAHUQ-53]|uniref:methyl-accepting chemotaxis protein n=1 Tax=unclassified Ramlibacter TaxID=2617605 RepID=UPI0036732723
MTLGQRLGLAFTLMLGLTLGVGGLGAERLSRVSASAAETDARWLPRINAVNDLRTAANRIRRTEADHVMAATPAQKADIEKRLAGFNADFLKKDKAYDDIAAPGEERAGFEAYARDRARYLAAQDKLLALSRDGAGDAARALYDGESRAAFDAMIVDLRTVAAVNEKGSKAAAATARDTYAQAQRWLLAMLVLAIAMAAVLGVWIVRGITRQLGAEPAEAAALARRVADGDLSAPITLRNGDSASLMAALKRMQDSLAAIVHNVRSGAEGVATASAQISQGTTDLSSRTEEQASALEQTSASMKELASTVEQNAANAQQGSRLASEASGVAQRGGEVVRQVVETMKGINDSSRQIADIISVIDGIAFQTNILALNAAVEAARAGEQGRGFAVVAGEVRTLAQRSAEAAKQIKDLITTSVERVGEGSALVDQAGTTMGEVVDAIQRVSDLMASISRASTEQSAGVAQIGEAVNQMDTTTQQNAALVEESAAASDSLQSQARNLVGVVSVFRLAAT